MFFYHGRLFVFDSSIRLIRDVLNILHVCVEMFSICVDLKWPCMKYVQYHQRQKRCTMPFRSFYQTAEEKNCNKNKSKTKLSSIAFAYSWSLECSWMSAFMWNASLKLLFNFLAYPISFPSSIGRFFVGPLLHARNMRWIVWVFFGLRERERTHSTPITKSKHVRRTSNVISAMPNEAFQFFSWIYSRRYRYKIDFF